MPDLTRIDHDGGIVAPELWARDHYTTIAYAFTRAGTTLDWRKLRARSERYPTRLKEGLKLYGHDDIDCLEDAVAAGVLATCSGHTECPFVTFTAEGLKLGQWLRTKIDAGGFSTMMLTWEAAVRESGADLPVDLLASRGYYVHDGGDNAAV